MEKLATPEKLTKGILKATNLIIDGLKVSNSQVRRLERELRNLKEEVSDKDLMRQSVWLFENKAVDLPRNRNWPCQDEERRDKARDSQEGDQVSEAE